MEYLRQHYGPKTEMKNVYRPPPTVSSAHEFFNPVVFNRWGGIYPQADPERKVVLDLEPTPTMLFQHSPTFAYRPDTSNIDVDL